MKGIALALWIPLYVCNYVKLLLKTKDTYVYTKINYIHITDQDIEINNLM